MLSEGCFEPRSTPDPHSALLRVTLKPARAPGRHAVEPHSVYKPTEFHGGGQTRFPHRGLLPAIIPSIPHTYECNEPSFRVVTFPT